MLHPQAIVAVADGEAERPPWGGGERGGSWVFKCQWLRENLYTVSVLVVYCPCRVLARGLQTCTE